MKKLLIIFILSAGCGQIPEEKEEKPMFKINDTWEMSETPKLIDFRRNGYTVLYMDYDSIIHFGGIKWVPEYRQRVIQTTYVVSKIKDNVKVEPNFSNIEDYIQFTYFRLRDSVYIDKDCYCVPYIDVRNWGGSGMNYDPYKHGGIKWKEPGE